MPRIHADRPASVDDGHSSSARPTMEVIDYAPWRDRQDPAVVAAVDRSFCETGFVVLRHHGVDADTLAGVRSSAAQFFSLTNAAKAAYAPAGRAYSGWTGVGAPSRAATRRLSALPDLRETFAMGLDGAEQVPSEVPSLGFTWALARRSLHRLAESLVDLCEVALGVPTGSMSRVFRGSEVNMVANWYPPFTAVRSFAEAGADRIGAHTDVGTLSLLDRRPTAAGLQVEVDGAWIDVPWEEGCLTVNIGDLMAHWTSGRWRSSVHRVPAPSIDRPDEDLLSIVGFHRPNAEAVIEPIGGGERTRCGDWMDSRVVALTLD